MLMCAQQHYIKMVRARMCVQFQSVEGAVVVFGGCQKNFKKGFDGFGSGAYKPPHDAAGLVERLARGRLVRL